MKVLDVKQGSAQWFAARAGKVTGSKVADAVAFLKRGGETQARANYRAQIVAETLTGQPELDGYLSSYMQWGTDQEKFARAAYELEQGVMVDTIGFVVHDDIDHMGGSPDGLIGEDGGVEIKCPKTTTHIRWIIAGKVPPEHIPQMQFYMAITGRAWWDFVSYDPRVIDPLQLFVRRLERNDQAIAELEAGVVQFLGEVDAEIAYLEKMVGKLPKPPELYPAEEGFLTEEDFYGLVGAE